MRLLTATQQLFVYNLRHVTAATLSSLHGPSPRAPR